MNIKQIAIAFFSFTLLAGCQSGPTEREGAVLGAIAGGILGNQVGEGSGRTAAIIAGTLLGAYLGGELANHMDENDNYRAQEALEDNRSHQVSSWQNPDTGYEYTVTPTRTYETSSGPCREYTTEAVISGKREVVYGTACRQPDGSWQATN